MKKLVWIALFTMLAATQPAAQAADPHLKRILESGFLRFGTTGDWNPMSVRDTASGSYKGFDIDIATELAKDMGVKLVFVPTDWKTLVNGVVADKYDLTSSASLNPKRAKVAGYTDSYFSVATVPVTRKDLGDKLKEWDDQLWLNYLNHWIKLKKARGFFDGLAEKWQLAGR